MIDFGSAIQVKILDLFAKHSTLTVNEVMQYYMVNRVLTTREKSNLNCRVRRAFSALENTNTIIRKTVYTDTKIPYFQYELVR